MSRKGKNICGDRIRQARLSAKPPLTQDALSGQIAVQDIHLDRSAIAKIETGIRYVNDFELLALSKALGVSIAWLLEVE